MTCREFIEFLYAYDAGGLADAERAVFDDHLAECPACQVYLRTYRQAVRLGKAAFAPTNDAVPAEVPEELVQAILATRASV
ncbi:MAG: zf-HC2 domain-containing protein [Gemmataceae bacterium]